jgi:hypothetical protein
MKKDLSQLADEVETEQDLLLFIQALQHDRTEEEEIEKNKLSSKYTAGANGWENGDIVGFLSAIESWGNSTINGLSTYKKPENPWKCIFWRKVITDSGLS